MSLQIESARPDDKQSIVALLHQGQLLTDDLPTDLSDFVIAKDKGVSIGVAGLERLDGVGLLRSVAVDPDYQGHQIAAQLVSHLLDSAKTTAITDVYLITTTADQYFQRHGFYPVDRQDVPLSIQQTVQFSDLCPSSAIVMKLSLPQDNS